VEPFTLTRKFLKQEIIDGFKSIIWTERYYGNSEVELVVPATSEMIKKLPEGTFLGIDGSKEVMILQTKEIKEGDLTLTGISLLPWLNNRFVRASAKHEDVTWKISQQTAGQALWTIIFNMCCQGSPFLSGATPIGIPNPQQFIIPGLGLKNYDNSGVKMDWDIEYGAPVYDAMANIATGAQIGMQITLESATDTAYSLGFRSYKGLDRTSNQTVNPVVRFSPVMDSLANITELRSLESFKTVVYTFARLNESDYALAPVSAGEARLAGTQYTGFDLRALMVAVDGFNPDDIDATKVKNILNTRAALELANAEFIKMVDGEIVPTNQFQYGIHFSLGDLIEVQGNSEIVSISRVTEYIRAQDEAGEKAYPAVTMLD
jgi:Siphovirus ReqiPepy6 Gp37-like protein